MSSKIFISSILLFTLAACSSTKLIIKSEKDKHVLKIGTSVAITHLGEAYPFDENCNSTCKNCDSRLKNARWWIDSLNSERMVLHYEHSHLMDTISNDEFKNRSKAEKKKNLFKVIVYNKKPAYVYQIPDSVEYKEVRFKSLETITYSDRPECYRGSPIKAIFHNPNKIRKIMMPGAEIRIKY